MVTFAIAAALLVILASACWYSAIGIGRKQVLEEQRALALEQINIYRLRCKDLSVQREHEELDENEYESSVIELKRQLLFDLQAQGRSDGNKRYSLVMPGVLFLVLFVGLFYFVNGESQKLEQWAEVRQALPALGERALKGQGDSLSAKELQQFALGLRTQLFENGDDAIAWMLLGKVTLALRDLESALQAFDKAYRLDPQKEITLINYSSALLMEGDAASLRKAAMMLASVLATDPGNVEALYMVGYLAELHQDWDKARLSWQRLKNALPSDDPRRAMVDEKIASIAQRASGSGQMAAADSGAGAHGAVSLKVHLTLDKSLAGKVPPGAVLFVYAKSPTGRPMPAAVVKMSRFELPMTVELSDKNAMMPSYNLSSLSEAVVYCRISKDGNIGISPGELQGQTETITLKGAQEVSIVIDQLL